MSRMSQGQSLITLVTLVTTPALHSPVSTLADYPRCDPGGQTRARHPADRAPGPRGDDDPNQEQDPRPDPWRITVRPLQSTEHLGSELLPEPAQAGFLLMIHSHD